MYLFKFDVVTLIGIEETTLIYLAIPSMWRVPVRVEDVQWMAMLIQL